MRAPGAYVRRGVRRNPATGAGGEAWGYSGIGVQMSPGLPPNPSVDVTRNAMGGVGEGPSPCRFAAVPLPNSLGEGPERFAPARVARRRLQA